MISSVQEVVLAPTRELAQQIADELTNLAHFIKGLKIAVIYGGQPFWKANECAESQTASARWQHWDVCLTICSAAIFASERVHTMVLDEADEMLKMGFVQDVEKIIESADSESSAGDVQRDDQSGCIDGFVEIPA